MRFWQVFSDDIEAADFKAARWCGTKEEAHDMAKSLTRRVDVVLREVEINTDKQGVLHLLRGELDDALDKYISEWQLTPRGGMQKTELSV